MTISLINTPISPTSTRSTPLYISRSPSPSTTGFGSLVSTMEQVKEELKSARQLIGQKDGKIIFLISQLEKKKTENNSLMMQKKTLELKVTEQGDLIEQLSEENKQVKNELKLKEGSNLLLRYKNTKLMNEKISTSSHFESSLNILDFIKHYKNSLNIRGEILNKLYAKKCLENKNEELIELYELMKEYEKEKKSKDFSSVLPSFSSSYMASEERTSLFTKSEMDSNQFNTLKFDYSERNEFPLHDTINYKRDEITSQSYSQSNSNLNSSIVSNQSFSNNSKDLPTDILKKIFSSPTSMDSNILSSPPSRSSGSSSVSNASSASTINNYTNIITPSTIDTIDRSIQPYSFQNKYLNPNNLFGDLFNEENEEKYNNNVENDIIHAHSNHLSEDSTLDAHDLSCHTLNTTLEQFPTQILSPSSTIASKKDSILSVTPSSSVKDKDQNELLSPYSAYFKNKISSANRINGTTPNSLSEEKSNFSHSSSVYFQDHLTQVRSENSKLRNEINEFKNRLESLKKDCINIRNSSLNLDKNNVNIQSSSLSSLPTSNLSTSISAQPYYSSLYHSTSSLYPVSKPYSISNQASVAPPTTHFIPLPPLPSFNFGYYNSYSSTTTNNFSSSSYISSNTTKSFSNVYDKNISI